MRTNSHPIGRCVFVTGAEDVVMIHLNHAGTSWPKPPEVVAAARATLEAAPGDATSVLSDGQRAVARFLGVNDAPDDAERVLFTSGCTAAIALAIPLLPWSRGDVIVTSGLEHHALAGPIETLTRLAGVEWVVVPPGGGAPLDLDRVEERLRRGRVRLVATTHASNVTGALLPVARLAALAHDHGALFFLDAAQSVGNLPLDVVALGADLVAFAGHKGPLGPPGVGVLWIAPHVELLAPAASCALPVPGAAPTCRPLPGFCDAGSANLPAIAGLTAGLAHLEKRGLHAVRAHALALTERLLAGIAEFEHVQVVGPADADDRLAVVSTTIDEASPQDAERRLATSHGITVRAGHHCAPLAHDTLGTTAEGTLRLSFGPTNTPHDIDAALAGLAELRPG